jgi:hypothetical protein
MSPRYTKVPDPTNAVTSPPVPTPEPVQLKEVAAYLVKHYGFHEGLWDVVVEMQVAVGAFAGPSGPSDVLPGAMFRVQRIGLVRVPVEGALTVNAAIVNPAPAT